MQDILTHAIELVAIAHLTLSLINAMTRRRKPAPGQLSLFADVDMQDLPEVEPDNGEWLVEVQAIVIPDGVALVDANVTDAALVESFTQFVAQFWQSRPLDNIVPFVRKQHQQAIDWSQVGIRELRRFYSERGLSGLKLSHASKQQLVDVLSAA